jgi:predicted ATP-grasp superfamily ATP-dependent carboligase
MKPLVGAGGEVLQCIPEMVIESVNQTDVDLHKELLSGVILTGMHISHTLSSNAILRTTRTTTRWGCLASAAC